MPIPGRKRASLVLLLVLAAGLAAATSAAATGAQEMACCPAGLESGCTWLGASDCCRERPTAPAPTSTATSPAGACSVLTLLDVTFARLVPAARTMLPQAAPRNLVLRL